MDNILTVEREYVVRGPQRCSAWSITGSRLPLTQFSDYEARMWAPNWTNEQEQWDSGSDSRGQSAQGTSTNPGARVERPCANDVLGLRGGGLSRCRRSGGAGRSFLSGLEMRGGGAVWADGPLQWAEQMGALWLGAAGLLVVGVLLHVATRPAPQRAAALVQALAVAASCLCIALSDSCDAGPYTLACLRQGVVKQFFLLVDFFWFAIQCVEMARMLSCGVGAEVPLAEARGRAGCCGGRADVDGSARRECCCRPLPGSSFSPADCRRFAWYSLYGFGVPSLLCLAAVAEQLLLQSDDSPYSPGPYCCWLYSAVPGWVFYHGPVAAQLVVAWAALCCSPVLRARRRPPPAAGCEAACPPPRLSLLFAAGGGAWLFEAVCFSRGRLLDLWAATAAAVLLRAGLIAATLLGSPEMWRGLVWRLRRRSRRRPVDVQVELEMEVHSGAMAGTPAPAPAPIAAPAVPQAPRRRVELCPVTAAAACPWPLVACRAAAPAAPPAATADGPTLVRATIFSGPAAVYSVPVNLCAGPGHAP